eukprot:2480782-Pyramimonas_sp.AAC.1
MDQSVAGSGGISGKHCPPSHYIPDLSLAHSRIGTHDVESGRHAVMACCGRLNSSTKGVALNAQSSGLESINLRVSIAKCPYKRPPTG